jgi:polar amino acid transport system substrate-binding protein
MIEMRALAVVLLCLPTAIVAAEEIPLRTAVDATFAPHAFPDFTGGVQGFNVDLANEIGKRLRRKIQIQVMPIDSILPELRDGRLDFVAAPTTVTKERAEALLFTEAYLDADYQLVVKRGANKIDRLEQLDSKVLAVGEGTTYETWARGLTERIGWTVESFPTQADAMRAVLEDRASAYVAVSSVAAFAAKNNPQLELSYRYKTGLVWAVPVRKDQIKLREDIENAIECMKRDGAMVAMHEKWFGVTPPTTSSALTVFPGTGVPGMAGYDPTPREPGCDNARPG